MYFAVSEPSFLGVPWELLHSFPFRLHCVLPGGSQEFPWRVLRMNGAVSRVPLLKSHRVCVTPSCRCNSCYRCAFPQPLSPCSHLSYPAIILGWPLSEQSLGSRKPHPSHRHLLFPWLSVQFLLSMCALVFLWLHWTVHHSSVSVPWCHHFIPFALHDHLCLNVFLTAKC